MKKFKDISIILLIFSFLLIGTTTSSVTQNIDVGNVYAKWIRLSLSGKNQAEIEYFFRNLKEKDLNKVKNQLRVAILDKLKRSTLKQLIKYGQDLDDMNIIIKKIQTEIRYAGMELDEILKLDIKRYFNLDNSFL